MCNTLRYKFHEKKMCKKFNFFFLVNFFNFGNNWLEILTTSYNRLCSDSLVFPLKNFNYFKRFKRKLDAFKHNRKSNKIRRNINTESMNPFTVFD